MVTYTYDSWGKVTEVGGSNQTLGNLNPFRYKGYYYDAETGLYYLNSRYYDPQVGRFISADDVDILDLQDDLYDKNLYSYCDNNPVTRVDVSGDMWELALVSGGTWFVSTGISLNAISGVIIASASVIVPVLVIASITVVAVAVTVNYKKVKSKQKENLSTGSGIISNTKIKSKFKKDWNERVTRILLKKMV